MKINIPHTAKSFFANNYQAHTNQNILLLCFSEEEAISAYHQSLFFKTSKAISESYYLPSFDTVPYDRISPNNNILSERAKVLSNLANSLHNNALVITNAANLLIKLPPPEIFTSTSLALSKGMKYTLAQLSNFLIQNGFIRSSTAIDSGEFAMRGEIIDIILQGNLAYRINFSWNQIESIKQYDLESQISTKNCDHLILNSASEIIFNSETINNFKNNYLTTFGVNYTKELLYESVIERRKFPGFEHLLPLFYNQLSSLLDYLPNATIIYDNLALQSLAEYEFSIHDFYNSRLQSNLVRTNGFYPVLLPERLYFSNNEIVKILKNNNNLAIEQTQVEALPPPFPWNKLNIKSIDNLKDDEIFKKTKFDKLVKLINNNVDKVVVLFCRSNSGCERLKNIISSFNFQYNEIDNLSAAKIKVINIVRLSLKSGFSTDKYLLISEQDFFGEKFSSFSSLNSKARLKNILTELDSLQVGELIVYKEHGIGQFFAIETIEVGGKPHDCLKILYAGNDCLYVPVENIELIKKYGNFEGELDKLGSLSWQKRKSKLKNRINVIADELLKIAAARKLSVTEPVEYELSLYDKFCSKFTYSETEDQLKAIEDVKEDLTSGKLMDRLICGDVGFGKTEIAMRTAYMVAANTHEPAQIAIIAPTTILCKQHYSRFLERFRGFGFNILQLSRLIKKSEIKSIKEQIKNGRATIIVGTHALLAKDIEFSNLKLLIIDEEQHFGVSQKERLKQLKSEVHVLSLSATPIPRTLQMSLVGLKELSLIATPPLDRLAVRTTVMPFDDVIIRDALLREHFRGGRSFYVCPRIKDILEVEKKLQAIVPELKYRIAHGQMPPVSVDDVMNEFYDGKVDILLSTTIIESGIDISTANTMIIHKADQLGLSQLYQLRGRVGRSNVRGYAYLTLNNNKKISKHALKRLEIMQNVDSLGAGFTIASHDMDIRGFGNLVGEKQSGQIKEVGVELYQEMLDEQIGNLKDDQVNSANESFTTTINLGLPVFIPKDYVNDSSLRLGIYRRVGSLSANEEVESFKDEIIDRFGPMPEEFDNLLNIVKIKLICQSLKIESLDSGTQGFVLKFYKNADVADMITKFISKYPRSAKIKPDNKLIFIKPLENQNIIKEVHELLNHLQTLIICKDCY